MSAKQRFIFLYYCDSWNQAQRLSFQTSLHLKIPRGVMQNGGTMLGGYPLDSSSNPVHQYIPTPHLGLKTV